jgi:hypothetical protein
MAGIQCPKQLYLKTYHPELAEEPANLRAIFNTGHRVGDFQRRRRNAHSYRTVMSLIDVH